MATATATAVQVLERAEAWAEAWAKARERGWETLLLDAASDGLSIFLFHPESHHHQEIRLSAKEPQAIPLPMDMNIGEATWALGLAVDQLPWLSWAETYRHRRVLGKGIFVYPLGPVHADVAESVLYRLSVMGDDIVRLTVENGFKPRNIRQLCQGKTVNEVLALVERMTTTSTVAHALAYSLAVEQALDWPTAKGASWVRMLLAELERMVSHTGDLALLAASTGLPVPQMEYLACKEAILRVNFNLFGHRYLRGVVQPGGVTSHHIRPPDANDYRLARQRLSEEWERIRSVRQDLDRTPSFLDRLDGAGTIPLHTREFVRPVGPVGRAAGRPFDVRRMHPYLNYSDVPLETPCLATGDSRGRYTVKATELEQSFSLIMALLERPERLNLADQTDVREVASAAGPPCAGMAFIEAPRGLMAYRVALSQDRTIARVAIATPSQRNWYVVAPAVANHNILQDFPIIDASFNLSVAGWDG